jgi:hypothetical protein
MNEKGEEDPDYQQPLSVMSALSPVHSGVEWAHIWPSDRRKQTLTSSLPGKGLNDNFTALHKELVEVANED